jgi:DNA repair exonuclease SbcCD ATPase subunit
MTPTNEIGDVKWIHIIERDKRIAELEAELERLRVYVGRGVDVFASPCEKHSGENTPPFDVFFVKYGHRCLICTVDELGRLREENERLREENERLKKLMKAQWDVKWIHIIERDKRIAELKAELERLREENERKSKNDAEIAIGGWLSAALDDPNVCAQMKLDIVRWFTFFDGDMKRKSAGKLED